MSSFALSKWDLEASHDKLHRSHTMVTMLTMPVNDVLKLQLQLQPLFRLMTQRVSSSLMAIKEGHGHLGTSCTKQVTLTLCCCCSLLLLGLRKTSHQNQKESKAPNWKGNSRRSVRIPGGYLCNGKSSSSDKKSPLSPLRIHNPKVHSIPVRFLIDKVHHCSWSCLALLHKFSQTQFCPRCMQRVSLVHTCSPSSSASCNYDLKPLQMS